MKSMHQMLEIYEQKQFIEPSAKDKQRVFHAASSGLFIREANITCGSCPRAAVLRFLGVETKPKTTLMIDAGVSNERVWEDVFTANGIKYIKEKEFNYLVQEGGGGGKPDFRVVGRPDFLLLSSNENVVKGIELKLVSSMHKAVDVLSCKVSLQHVCQASLYNLMTGLPFELWYSSRVNWALGYRAKYAPHNEVIDNFYACDKKGMPFNIMPFIYGFRIVCLEGAVTLHDLTLHQGGLATIVTTQRLLEYFDLCSEMIRNDCCYWHIPHKSIQLDGTEDDKDPCQYCDYGIQHICRAQQCSLSELYAAASVAQTL